MSTSEEFREELTHLLNRHSKENGSGTPDYILAEYLIGCLAMFDVTIEKRAAWRGDPVGLLTGGIDVNNTIFWGDKSNE